MLRASTHQAAVLPLALPEWRTDPRGGSLVEENGRLALTQEINGRALCCPLFIDLKPGGRRKNAPGGSSPSPNGWKSCRAMSPSAFVPNPAATNGCSIARSVPPGNRTVLGQNISGEFSAGRFRRTGKYDEWIEIEAV